MMLPAIRASVTPVARIRHALIGIFELAK